MQAQRIGAALLIALIVMVVLLLTIISGCVATRQSNVVIRPIGGSETSAEIYMIQSIDELPNETTIPE